MAKVIWGVLGCADFARRRTIPALLQTPSAALVGVASRAPDKAEALRAEFQLPQAFGSYDAMLADPRIQAIYIPLPNGLHAEWIIRAAECGKHVLCEKPLTVNADEAARVARVAQRTGARIMEAFMWRFHSRHLKARDAVQRGAIGTLRIVRSSFSFLLPRKANVRFDPDLGGGSILDVGCYPVSAARFYFGDEPAAAFAECDTDPEFRVDTRMDGILRFPQGRAAVDCAFNLPYRTGIELIGEDGMLSLPQPWRADAPASLILNGREETFPVENHYISQFEHFSQCLLHDVPPAYGPEDALRQMRVLDAVRRSCLSGVPEDISRE
jgi:D-xylose 1-dehydrogenase (NADP+, D-xylono-1,5-lactone-forming)